MTPARLLLTTDVVGGVWDFAATLAGELARRGTHCLLLALGEPSPDQRRQAAEAGAELVSEPLRLEWMQDSQADVLASQRLLARVVAEARPDVVHANQFAAACAGLEVPVLLTVHSDVLSWRAWSLGARDVPAEWQAYAGLVRRALAEADAVVAVSHFLAAELRAHYATTRPIEVIHNGWPTGGLSVTRTHEHATALADAGADGDAGAHAEAIVPADAGGPQASVVRGSTTLVAGRVWDRAKNIQLALRAVPAGAEVLLAGEQRDPDSGVAVDLRGPVQALGFVPRQRLDALLRQARVYLSPARYDPFGLLPLQAALAGCALLLSDIPSYREVWHDAAVFFSPDDPLDLRQRWTALLADDATCTDLARRARRRAQARYSAAAMAERYLARYARLVARVAA